VKHSIDGSRLVSKRNAKHAFRQRIFDAWDSTCAYCGVSAGTLDHVKSRYGGGDTVVNNLVPACEECNRSKGSENWFNWFSRRDTFTDQRVNRIQQWINKEVGGEGE
jgi:Restriction endonuclease